MVTPSVSPADRRDWLALHRLPGVGPILFGKLLARFGNPSQALAEIAQWRHILEQRGDLFRHETVLLDWAGVEKDLLWAEQPDHTIITLGDSCYPPLLQEIPDPPPVIYVRGNVQVLAMPQVALVGTRSPSDGGRETARAFAHALASQGWGITSGLAYGVDAQAHEGALEAGGITIAVAGTGLDRVYPSRHKALAQRIAEQGALVAEYPLGTPPLPTHFPRRNRLISGLSLGTVVVEAAVHSGSLITARMAVEQGREVFAIPGSIHNPLARGCHALIRQGAKLVETAQDIWEELASLTQLAITISRSSPTISSVVGSPDELDSTEQQLLLLMGFNSVGVDNLVDRSGLTAEKLSSILLGLELRGYVVAQPGGLYARATRG